MNDPIPQILSSIRLRKEIHPKFFYFGKGAHNWDRLSRDKKYRLGKAEERFLVRSLDEISEIIGTSSINLVDLGPGSGYKARLILKRILAREMPVMYAALDISEEILKLALKNLGKSFQGSLKTKSFLVDFEEESISPILNDLRRRFNRTGLVLLLGSGNVTNKPRVMENIREGMTASDYFLVSAELLNSGNLDRILNHYRRKEALDVVFFGLRMLGVRGSDGHFDIRFNRSKSQVEIYFIFNKNFTVSSRGELTLKKGTKIRLFTSYKPTVTSLKRFLKKIGFEIKKLLIDEKENLALVLCKKGTSF